MKYSGLVLLLIIAVSVYLSWDEVGSKQYIPSNSDSSLVELQELKSKTLVQTSQKAKASLVNQQVEAIAAYQSAANINTNLIALAPTAPVINKPTVTLPSQRYTPYTRVVVKRYKDYAVSMIFIAPNNRYAVIDDHFSRVGDVLPDGGKVVSIEDSYVEVKRGKKIETFKIRS
ncbi:hypothetical protein THMIRHAM_20980 [Thiomicrorhabdus immobilis]|uniref:Type IV pilus biogenesis protein PilP n=1 Tax=Thiomicrorhabdus immobilis TaxID=2791037 RepID=A0ABM7MFM1_9GAMM|nr:hypothetical protein [Thiomicrorhabdus immobilis]BCN94313.1 hypothetical protein THMIRHAM_20980 [Thiomicrorhabdus immobilis]